MNSFLHSIVIPIGLLTLPLSAFGFPQADPLERIAVAVSQAKGPSESRQRAIEALIVEFTRTQKSDLVKRLVGDKGNANFLTPNKDSLLHLAAANGDNNLLQFFLARDLDVNTTNPMGLTPIHMAIAHNHPDSVELLRENGATIDSKNGRVSSLSVAVTNGHLEMVKQLIDMGADLNHQNEQGNTALHLAIETANLAITELLVQSNSKLDIRNKTGLTPIEYAKKQMGTMNELEGKRRWGVEQVIGKPDAGTGDDPLAWAPGNTRQREWLIVHFEQKAIPDKVKIYECNSVGAVRKITVFDDDGNEKLAWIGRDPVKAEGKHKTSLIDLDTTVKTNKIKIYIAGDEFESWNEIDAVGLIDTDENIQWAVWATASSCYAGNESPFQSQRMIYQLLEQQSVAASESSSNK